MIVVVLIQYEEDLVLLSLDVLYFSYVGFGLHQIEWVGYVAFHFVRVMQADVLQTM